MADFRLLMDSVGEKIRRRRNSLRLTLSDLEERSGVSYQHLSSIENGQQNPSSETLYRISQALDLSVEYLFRAKEAATQGSWIPNVDGRFLRDVPLPAGLEARHILDVMRDTQKIVHELNKDFMGRSGKRLCAVIQGNNFSGLVSNLLSTSFDRLTRFKHNHHQEYPDLILSPASRKTEGLEVKVTKNVKKGGESHNGHAGWHIIFCYQLRDLGDIEFIHVMCADLTSHRDPSPDWKRLGSRIDETTGSQRTETYTTTLRGTSKLRDGSVYLNSDYVNFSRWRRDPDLPLPRYSIFQKS